MDFLMSGEREVLETIAALAEKGYESHPVQFNTDNGWQALTWLAVTEELAGDAKTVRHTDPGAIRI